MVLYLCREIINNNVQVNRYQFNACILVFQKKVKSEKSRNVFSKNKRKKNRYFSPKIFCSQFAKCF